MKKLLFILMLSCLSLQGQTNSELIAEAKELAKNNPTDTFITLKLKKVLSTEPNNEEALYEICLFHFNKEAYHYMDRYTADLIKTNPTNASYYWLRAQGLILGQPMLENLFLAKKDIEKVKSLNGSTTARLERAISYANIKISKRYYEKANNVVDHERAASFDDPKELPEKAEFYKLSNTYLDSCLNITKKLTLDKENFLEENPKLSSLIDQQIKNLSNIE